MADKSEINEFIRNHFPFDPEWDQKYENNGKLGEGSFASVYLIFEKASGLKKAVKVIPHRWVLSKNGRINDFLKEYNIMKTLIDPLFLEVDQTCSFLLPHEITPGVMIPHCGIIMEYFTKQTLAIFVDNSQPLTDPTIMHIIKQIADAVKYLHDLNIAHRDIKLENILINNNLDIKLIDFGLSFFFNKQTLTRIPKSSHLAGTPLYMPPEILNFKIRNTAELPAGDIWSFGVCIYYIITKKMPYNVNSNQGLRQLRMKIQQSRTYSHINNACLRKIIENCLQKETEDRWDINKLQETINDGIKEQTAAEAAAAEAEEETEEVVGETEVVEEVVEEAEDFDLA